LAIKNGQSRNTGNIGHKAKNEDKQTQNRKQKTMTNIDPPKNR